MFKKISINQRTLQEYIRYEHEIALDTIETLMRENIPLIIESVDTIGYHHLHHIIKFHQRTIINFLYFKEKKLILEYLYWLYRVYYHRDVDIDFFKLFFEIKLSITKKYLDTNSYLQIEKIYKQIISNHHLLKKESSIEKTILDNKQKVENLANLLIEGKKSEAFEVFKSECPDIGSFCKFYQNTFAPAMKKVGWLWETNTISVAKEHLASSVANDIIFNILEKLEIKEQNNQTILLSTAPEETHGLGNKIISKVLEKSGCTVINLGSSLPSADILKAIDEFIPDIIIFSATLPTSLYDIATILKELNENKYEKSYKVIIGGNAFENILHPSKSVGADIYCRSIKDVINFINEDNKLLS